MKRYLLGAALSSVLLCAPVMAQDASQTVERLRKSLSSPMQRQLRRRWLSHMSCP